MMNACASTIAPFRPFCLHLRMKFLLIPLFQFALSFAVRAESKPNILLILADDDARTLDGVNLLAKLTNDNTDPFHDKLYWHKLWFSAMRDGPWKLIYVQDYGYALYNLAGDLGEKKNLAKQHPDRVESMTKDMNTWKSQMMTPLWGEGENWFRVHSKNHIRIIEGK